MVCFYVRQEHAYEDVTDILFNFFPPQALSNWNHASIAGLEVLFSVLLEHVSEYIISVLRVLWAIFRINLKDLLNNTASVVFTLWGIACAALLCSITFETAPEDKMKTNLRNLRQLRSNSCFIDCLFIDCSFRLFRGTFLSYTSFITFQLFRYSFSSSAIYHKK